MSLSVKRILADTLGIAEDALPPDAAAGQIPGWDSVAHLNFVLSLEANFQISLMPDEIAAMTSLEKARAALARHGVKTD